MYLSHIRERKRFYIALIVSLTLIFAGLFSIRGVILRKAINTINSRLLAHQYVAHWDGARFRGFKTLFIKGIDIQHKYVANEIHIDSVSIRVRILPLFLKHVRINKLDCKAISVRYFPGDSVIRQMQSVSNDSAIQQKVVPESDSTDLLDRLKTRNLADFANRNIRRFFSYTPTRVHIGRMDVRLSYSGNTSMIGFHDFNMVKGKLEAKVNLSDSSASVQIPLVGRFDKSTSIIEVHLINADKNLLPVPLLMDKYGFAAGFDSLNFMIDLSQRGRHLVNMDGIFSIAGFALKGNRLSTDTISVDHFSSSFRFNIGENSFEVDSSTQAFLNRIQLNPYFRFYLWGDPEITFKLRPAKWNAEYFFSSLPKGMFTSLPKLRAEGMLNYYLTFYVNLNQPDSLKFSTKLTGDHFNILEYGSEDYRMLNGSFMHRVYERGRMVAAFEVGPENPDFTPFEQISPFLRAAVMTSEDGSFFFHNGFNPNAFRESIVTNIKEKRFARGGSTISMQLVKNVFLTRNKTLARKIEEALIVWMIENKHLVSKQRMYEVYLNIIEWGPGIYGINQASRFYFDKKPYDLNLTESIYLASIVPHPKWYKYTFESNGITRPFFRNYYDFIVALMLRREHLTPLDTVGVYPAVLLTGPASQVFTRPDSAELDTVKIDELQILPLLESF